jgi:hypothetical protein
LNGKIVFCNCDDPYESNFFKYFALNFNALKLKKLIATSYVPSPVAGKQLSLFEIEGLKPQDAEQTAKEPFKIEINAVEDYNKDGAVNLLDVEWLLKHDKNTATPLYGDDTYAAGDFRSRACVELLKKADVVVTNPPFSLFREYVAQLVEYDKKFLIIGNKNAITYKDIFYLIKENKLWTGVRSFSGGMWFVADYTGKYEKIVDGVKLINVPAIWITNMDNPKRHENIPLFKKYSPEEYPHYDNYDAIEVGKVAEIPVDYDGVMGVPITFIDKYNPDQFEILNCNDYRTNPKTPYKEHGLIKDKDGTINGKATYVRIVIKRKN